jgi:lipopolysaccharide/colanic/teichoic acid biosynthesis glycosyltransferase
VLKKLFDLLLSAGALLLLFPVFLIVAACIYSHDRGPVLFRQTRVGMNGQTFGILKFRSMVLNADKIGGYSTQANDPRITRIGRFIRRTSIDELPQLLNVLLGDMSIVGPRPNVPAQRAEYTGAEWDLRNAVRPGITGLAQAKFRSRCTASQRKELDLYYVENSSFLLDLKIILMTCRQVLSKGGN